MPAVAQIVIQVDDKGGISALNQFTNQAKQIGPAFQKSGQQGNVVMTQLTDQTYEAHSAAMLFGRYFGVQLPRQLDTFIAKSKTLGPIFANLFDAAIFTGFAFALVNVISAIPGLIDKLDALTDTSRVFYEAQQAINSTLVEQAKHLFELQQQYKLLGLEGLSLMGARQSEVNERLADAKKHLADVTKELTAYQTQLKKQADTQAEIQKKIGISAPQSGTALIAGIGTASSMTVEQAQRLAQIQNALTAASGEVRIWTQELANSRKELGSAATKKAFEDHLALLQADQAAMKETNKLYQSFVDLSLQPLLAAGKAASEWKVISEELDQDRKKRVVQASIDTQRIEEDTAVAILPPWQRAYAQIEVDAQRRVDEIHRQLDGLKGAEAYEAAQIRDVWIMESVQMRDTLADNLQSAFDDLISGRLGDRVRKMFERMVFQMIATWLLGMKTIQGSLGGVFGGSAGGGFSLGNILGIPSLGPGGTAPTFPSSGEVINMSGLPLNLGSAVGSPTLMSQIPGAGLSAGLGSMAGIVMPAGAGAATGLAGILTKIFPHGLKIGSLNISGAGLAALGAGLLFSSIGRGGVGGALGGAAGGALTGFAIGGPIGAIIGGIIGLFAGLFQPSTRKARLAIEADIKSQAQLVEDSYNLHQTDYNSAIGQLEQLRQQGVDALKQAGVKDIDRSRVGHVDHWVDLAEQDIQRSEQQRQSLLAASANYGPAQFRRGGYVNAGLGGAFGPLGVPVWAPRFDSGGAVPAILHSGEYVLRSEAVDRLGRANLDSLNAGGTGPGDIIVQGPLVSFTGGEDWLRNGGAQKVIAALRRLRREGHSV